MHCIVFHPDGSLKMARKICECDECFNWNLSKCLFGNKCVLYPKALAKNHLNKQNRSCKTIEDALNDRVTDEDISDNATDSEEEND